MDDYDGKRIDLTGLSVKTLVRMQELIERRVTELAERGEWDDELEALRKAYQEVNVAWFNRLCWMSPKRSQSH